MDLEKETREFMMDLPGTKSMIENSQYIIEKNNLTTLNIQWNHGFFSDTIVILLNIVKYFNYHKKLPDIVDTSKSFGNYKYDSNIDITFDFYEPPDKDIIIKYEKEVLMDYITAYHLSYYKEIDYNSLMPFIKKYFRPSKKINIIYNNLLHKYNIDYDNCIALYYRGTDKKTQTPLASFDSFYDKLNEVLNKCDNNNVQILIQTDSAQCLDYLKEKCLNKNIIVISENRTSYEDNGILYENTPTENYFAIQYLMATFLIISKCKYIILNSSCGSLMSMYFREGKNLENVFQNLNNNWF
jgi:hypothetical protein